MVPTGQAGTPATVVLGFQGRVGPKKVAAPPTQKPPTHTAEEVLVEKLHLWTVEEGQASVSHTAMGELGVLVHSVDVGCESLATSTLTGSC